MVIAFLVVRKRFSGKEVLDFTSNLGGAVPGTILGIGFILAFNTSPWFWSPSSSCYLALAFVPDRAWRSRHASRLVAFAAGHGYWASLTCTALPAYRATERLLSAGRHLHRAGPLSLADAAGRRGLAWMLIGMGVYLCCLQPGRVRCAPIAQLSMATPARLLDQRRLPVLRLHQGVLPDSRPADGDRLCVLVLAGYLQCGVDRHRDHALSLTVILLGLDRRHVLHGQAAGPGRHTLHHHGCLRRAQPAGLGARRRRLAAADRPVHRRGIEPSWAATRSTPSAR